MSLVVNVGMWLERFVIIVTSLHRDFLPSSWGKYTPTIWDWATFIGTIGLFLALLFLFLRFLPMISIFEMRTILPGAKVDEDRIEADLRGAERPRMYRFTACSRNSKIRPRWSMAAHRRTTAVTAAWTRIRRFRSKNCTTRSDRISRGFR